MLPCPSRWPKVWKMSRVTMHTGYFGRSGPFRRNRGKFAGTGRSVRQDDRGRGMIRFASGSGAVTGTQHIFERCMAEPRFPVPRAGLHYGVAVQRHGDWFGATVNLAARVASQARAGQVLATRAVADAARGTDIAMASLGEFTLRNIAAPVELFELQVCPPAGGFSIDPVCHMQIAITDAAGRLRHRGSEQWFCSLECAAAFAATPDRYVPGASN